MMVVRDGMFSQNEWLLKDTLLLLLLLLLLLKSFVALYNNFSFRCNMYENPEGRVRFLFHPLLTPISRTKFVV